ncbi:TerB family tellurite resistance protein [Actinomadura sp. BRA 177]|uniref:TerB family tellurite resistance protein n=1 Tax=Actinomadura sp. BRA 177 TaxID=2745202 RepID=UPI0015956B72|nr:TerB family tellurite resistance protein [Actinomadura sp. BRA 177]NVI91677.1 TerB family tellurite resistance protein [Actinomadura sp. BRA 177]
MLLVFGLTAVFRTVSEGTFHCPQCGGDRAYRRRAGRRWFSVFFVPMVPLWRLGHAVECRTCRGRFPVAALRTPTAQQMAETLAAGMRAAAALVLRAGDPSNAAARARAIATVTGYGEPEYDADAVNADLALRRTFLEREVVLAGAQLAVEAKEWFLAQAVRIGLADGQLGEGERQALHGIADLLGMSRAYALGVIVTTEGAAR